MIFTKVEGHLLILCIDIRMIRMDRANDPR